jgi:transcriptional regulator with XRE-family HTH domain
MINQFGERIKRLREDSHLLQRQVASELDIDSPMLSKIERGERRAKKTQVLLLSKIYNAAKKELLTLWLADQVYELVKDEETGSDALKVAENQFKYRIKKSNDQIK